MRKSFVSQRNRRGFHEQSLFRVGPHERELCVSLVGGSFKDLQMLCICGSMGVV